MSRQWALFFVGLAVCYFIFGIVATVAFIVAWFAFSALAALIRRGNGGQK